MSARRRYTLSATASWKPDSLPASSTKRATDQAAAMSDSSPFAHLVFRKCANVLELSRDNNLAGFIDEPPPSANADGS